MTESVTSYEGALLLTLEDRALLLALHSRINYAYRRMQECLTSRHT